VYVFADPRTQTSRPVPQPLRDVLQRYEAGDAMTSARIGGWDALAADVMQLRGHLPSPDVLALAPGIAACHDGGATHVVLVNRLAQTVAAARVWPADGSRHRLDGFTVHPALRGSGLTGMLLDATLGAARQEGAQELACDAPAGLAPALARAGFAVQRTPQDAPWSYVRRL
jgi:GNAT superfamily N-acetyltransferase